MQDNDSAGGLRVHVQDCTEDWSYETPSLSKTRIEDWLWNPVYNKHLHSNKPKQKLKHFFTCLKVFYLLDENINKDDYFLNNIYIGSFKIEKWRN